jgi:adenosylmethionine---8-amino-7-oxononanoate aminotransferase
MNDIDFDKTHIWHPFTQALGAKAPLYVSKAKGAYIYDDKNKAYLDLISSWWVTCHGHSHKQIAHAIYQQAKTLEQVIFAGFTHKPAVSLCRELLKVLPKNLSRFFFSDNGSTAVEVALKMAYQYFFNKNKPDKKIFLHFEGGYHGDTFGAMTVGKTSGFYKPFEDFFFKTLSIPFPETWIGDTDIDKKEEQALEVLNQHLKNHGHEICAFIMEVCVQGASGMKMARPQFFTKLCRLLKQHGIFLIFDEVMTGFYRTGKLFSFEHMGVVPDFLCLSKALSGGFLPLSLTITTEDVFLAFQSKDHSATFLHGHSFTANPLGCIAALKSLELFTHPKVAKKMTLIENEHRKGIQLLLKTNQIKKANVMGTIARFKLNDPKFTEILKEKMETQGFIIRPLKGVVYLLPPYVIALKDLKRTYKILYHMLIELQGSR